MKVFIKRDIKIINLHHLKKVENYKLKSHNIFLKLYINIDKNIKINVTEIEKCKFHQYKSPILIDNVDIQKVLSKILLAINLLEK